MAKYQGNSLGKGGAMLVWLKKDFSSSSAPTFFICGNPADKVGISQTQFSPDSDPPALNFTHFRWDFETFKFYKDYNSVFQKKGSSNDPEPEMSCEDFKVGEDATAGGEELIVMYIGPQLRQRSQVVERIVIAGVGKLQPNAGGFSTAYNTWLQGNTNFNLIPSDKDITITASNITLASGDSYGVDYMDDMLERMSGDFKIEIEKGFSFTADTKMITVAEEVEGDDD